MNEETYRVMSELSAPGSGAEGCFLHISQSEFYKDKAAQPRAFEAMPDVSALVIARYFD
jgi:hypothetical protein